METMFDTWVQYINTSLIKHCSLIKHGTNRRRNKNFSIKNILSKQLVVRVPILNHNPIIVARLTCIALIYLLPIVSDLRFICGLSEEGVVILLRLQAHLCYSDELAQSASVILSLLRLQAHLG